MAAAKAGVGAAEAAASVVTSQGKKGRSKKKRGNDGGNNANNAPGNSHNANEDDDDNGGEGGEQPDISEQKVKELHRRWSNAIYVPGAFSSADYLRRGMRAPAATTTAQVSKSLRRSVLYLLHRDLRERFRRRADAATFFGEKWEADLADFGKKVNRLLEDQEKERRKEESQGGREGGGEEKGGRRGAYSRRYVKRGERSGGSRVFLVVVDAFTRQIFARGMPDKSAESVADAFKSILAGLMPPFQQPPLLLETDQGREFRNSWFAAICESRGITLKSAKGIHKARLAERAIRSMKRVIMAAVQSGSWKSEDSWNVLVRQAASNLNARYNRGLGMSPNQVRAHYWRQMTKSWDRRHLEKLSRFMAIEKTLKKGGYFTAEGGKKFRIGQPVLIPIPKQRRAEVRDKEFQMHYEALPGEVSAIFHGERPALFLVRNPRTGKKEKRLFYAQELQPLELPDGIDLKEIEGWRIKPGIGVEYRVQGEWKKTDPTPPLR